MVYYSCGREWYSFCDSECCFLRFHFRGWVDTLCPSTSFRCFEAGATVPAFLLFVFLNERALKRKETPTRMIGVSLCFILYFS